MYKIKAKKRQKGTENGIFTQFFDSIQLKKNKFYKNTYSDISKKGRPIALFSISELGM